MQGASGGVLVHKGLELNQEDKLYLLDKYKRVYTQPA